MTDVNRVNNVPRGTNRNNNNSKGDNMITVKLTDEQATELCNYLLERIAEADAQVGTNARALDDCRARVEREADMSGSETMAQRRVLVATRVYESTVRKRDRIIDILNSLGF